MLNVNSKLKDLNNDADYQNENATNTSNEVIDKIWRFADLTRLLLKL